jgi:poly-gamma-glutamate synthesis protein (capsule biosynthesis protein)
MATISFVGDIGLNDDYIDLYQKNIHPFDALVPYLSDSDLLVGNLECIAKGDQGENLLKRPRIGTTLETLRYLEDIRMGMVSLATNHVYDNLEDGFRKTLDYLKRSNILYLGAGTRPETASRPAFFVKDGLSFCFLNYIAPDTNPALPADSTIYLNELNPDNCLKDLQKYSECNFRIVLMHWGGRFEGGLYPDYDQIGLARKLIDHGADLIIGHHSHTLQPYEKYKGKYIFYSLGNFCFSDIKFEGKIRSMSSSRERKSALVKVAFSGNHYSIKIIPFRNKKLILEIRRIAFLTLRLKNAFFKLLKFKPIWQVYRIYFKKFRPLWIQILRKDSDRSLLTRILHIKHF